MKGFKSLGLKKQFTIFIVISVSFILLLHGYFLLHVVQLNEQRTRQYADSIASSIAGTISVTATNLERAGYAFSFNQFLSSLYSGRSKIEYKEDVSAIFEMTKFIIDYNPDLLDVMVVEPSGRSTSFFAGVNDLIIDELKKSYDFSDVQDTRRFFCFFPPSSSVLSDYFFYIVPVFDIYYPYNSKIKLATAVFINKSSSIKNLVTSIDNKTTLFAIFNDSNRLIVSNSQTNNPDFFLPTIQKVNANAKVQKDIPALGLKLIGVLTASTPDEKAVLFIYYIIISASALIAVLIAAAIFVQHAVIHPIIRLNMELEHIGDNSQNRRIALGDSIDINLIAEKINHMLDKIDTTTRIIFDTQNKLYETELQKNKAELYALQSQINPHFLYNTLQCVRGLAMYHNVEEIAVISTAMSELFRYSIKGEEYVTISEEMNIVDKYLTIMSIRFSGKYTYQIDVDSRILNAKTIKMIIQPIVENAILHGLSDVEENGRLIIQGILDGNLITFKVTDNGKGISPEDLSYIYEVLTSDFHNSISVNSKCMGLYNINRRIKLHFGPEYGLSIISRSGFTEVSISFPLINKGKIP